MGMTSCDKLEKELSLQISRLKDTNIHNKEMKMLDAARRYTENLKELCRRLEKVDPENMISAQLKLLFVKAHDVICSYKKDACNGPEQMISKVVELIDSKKLGDLIKGLKPSRSCSSPITMKMVELVSAMLRWGRYCVCKKVPKLRVRVAYLKVFLELTANRCLENMENLFSHVEDVAYSLAPICVLNVNRDMESDFSQLLIRLSPCRPQVRKIYLTALIALKSLPESKAPMKSKYLKIFVDTVKEDLEELLAHDANLNVFFDGRIPWLRQGFSYLSAFLKDTSPKEFSSLQSQLEALAYETAIVIYSSYDKEINIERDDGLLPLQFKFIKAAVRQRCSTISSSTLYHSIIDLLPINFDVLDSYFSMKLDSSNTCSPNLAEVLKGFHKYILDSLLLKDETYLIFTAANEVKKLYDGMMILVMYPHLSDESCHKSFDEVNLHLKLLTVAFQLIESDRSLMDLLNHKATIEEQILDLIESAHQELIFVVAFLMDILGQPTELDGLHHLFRHAAMSVDKLAKIIGSKIFMDRNSAEKMRNLLSDYLQEMRSLKVEVKKLCFQVLDASPFNMTDGGGLTNFLLNHQDWLLNYDACSLPFLQKQFDQVKKTLVHLGSLLDDIVQYRDIHQQLKDVAKSVQDMKFVCLLPVRDYRPDWYYMLYLSDVTQFLNFVETRVKSICLEAPDLSDYRFPKTNGSGFLNCFLGKLDELLHSELDAIIDLKHRIELVKENLKNVSKLTYHNEESCDKNDEVYSMAYKAEYVIDSCLACSHPIWYKDLWISEVVENIKEVGKRKKVDAAVPKVEKTPFLEEVVDQVKKQLCGGSHQLDVISLVGMPGIGKTTLAEKIYNDMKATSYFDVHAQCRVTQVYSRRELLVTILNDVLEPCDRYKKEDGELADELRKLLLTKRFLILIDDVWDYDAWDSLHMCFRDAKKGSRIILTTRLANIADNAKYKSEPYHLRLFNDDESWALLQKEVFQGKRCPDDLRAVGIQIAKSCGGLPLVIVSVAGVLKAKKKKVEIWKEIVESLGSQNVGSLEKSMSVIEFSYKNLPDYLKPCFLYFGGMLKGKNVGISKLTRLWIAEGFVGANMEKGPEDAAECFLEDLISRNLVMGVEKRKNGKVKTCRIHDLLHKFCLDRAKEENFLLSINSGEDTFPEMLKEYRLFVHSQVVHNDLCHPYRSNVRSLLFDLKMLQWELDIYFIFGNFKLIRVLDLESIDIGVTFPCGVQSLIYLRYFTAQTGARLIPSWIEKLQNLETFVVKGLRGEVTLPGSLLNMVKLRHIHVKSRASLSLYEKRDESLAKSQLDNLETFSTPHLSYGEDTDEILRKMPRLRKLSCIVSGTVDYVEEKQEKCVIFPKLELLGHLESLKLVSGSYPIKLVHIFNFPSGLRELTLSKFQLPWSQICTIGELPHLEILKLLVGAFEGDKWEVNDSEFPELKYLELDDLNFVQWDVTEDAFVNLKHLVLTKCKWLDKIPSYLGEAPSLDIIEVNWCNFSVANSAKEILTVQHDELCNDSFTVTIQPPDWDR